MYLCNILPAYQMFYIASRLLLKVALEHCKNSVFYGYSPDRLMSDFFLTKPGRYFIKHTVHMSVVFCAH